MKSSGTTVYLRELTLLEAWPYVQGEPLDADHVVRLSLVDDQGKQVLGEGESLALQDGLELLYVVLEINNLVADKKDAGDQGGDDQGDALEAAFLSRASSG